MDGGVSPPSSLIFVPIDRVAGGLEMDKWLLSVDANLAGIGQLFVL